MAPRQKGFLWGFVTLLILYTEGCLVSAGHLFIVKPAANLTDEDVEMKLNTSYGLLFGEIATDVNVIPLRDSINSIIMGNGTTIITSAILSIPCALQRGLDPPHWNPDGYNAMPYKVYAQRLMEWSVHTANMDRLMQCAAIISQLGE